MWGVVSVIVFAALVGFQLRNWPALRVAYSLSANCQWEDAHAAFFALEGKGMPRPMRESASIALSALALSLGQPEKALERLALVIPRLRSSWRQGAMVNRWLATYLRAGALVRLGRLGEARQRRDEMRAWARGGRPRGEYYTLLQQSLDLAIAFEADAPDELPDDAVLHQWARAALLRSQFGEMLINLAWAFHRRGNDDMARHLFAEAPSRTPRYSLHVTSPRLHAWAEERRAAWLGNEGSEARPAPPLLGSGLTEA
jgi:tetratricopeptide (TPR) repeat protein